MMFLLYVGLTFAALVLLGAASRARGWTLWLALLTFGWLISQFSTLVEAVAFSVMPIQAATIQLGVALVAFAILSAVAVVLLGRWKGRPFTPTPTNVTVLSLALVVIGYEILYFGAGTLVWPFVEHFYADKPLPSRWLVAALQVPRALVFAAAALIWLRTGPRQAPLVLGVAFAVMGGIAPMFPDNPYMPADIRLAHGIETGSSNFLFGLLVGWLLKERRARPGLPKG